METIFAQLKKARESKGLSLANVASATNINIDFLKAIEQGKTMVLPQAYVRAFLREFASVVGLDPVYVMEEYDRETAPEKPEPAPKAAPPSPVPSPQRAKDLDEGKKGGARSSAIAAVTAVVILGGILYWNYSKPVERAEIKPEPVRQEEQQKPEPVPERRPEPEKIDTLRLDALTSDTVWVQVIIDSRDSLDYVLYPNATRSWNAMQSFRVSVGRPEAVQFTLNKVALGTLGPRARIVRNNLIDRSTLERLKEQN